MQLLGSLYPVGVLGLVVWESPSLALCIRDPEIYDPHVAGDASPGKLTSCTPQNFNEGTTGCRIDVSILSPPWLFFGLRA